MSVVVVVFLGAVFGLWTLDVCVFPCFLCVGGICFGDCSCLSLLIVFGAMFLVFIVLVENVFGSVCLVIVDRPCGGSCFF